MVKCTLCIRVIQSVNRLFNSFITKKNSESDFFERSGCKIFN